MKLIHGERNRGALIGTPVSRTVAMYRFKSDSCEEGVHCHGCNLNIRGDKKVNFLKEIYSGILSLNFKTS